MHSKIAYTLLARLREFCLLTWESAQLPADWNWQDYESVSQAHEAIAAAKRHGKRCRVRIDLSDSCLSKNREQLAFTHALAKVLKIARPLSMIASLFCEFDPVQIYTNSHAAGV